MEFILPGMSAAPNLHPMVVHFPIAFWLAAFGAWAVALFRRSDSAWSFGLWLQSLGLGGAALAVAWGFWATEKMGHSAPGHDLVHVHRDYMLFATGLAIIITVLGWLRRRSGARWRVALTAMSLVLVTAMSLGADRGAELVFRYGMGVSEATPPNQGEHGHADDHGHDHGQEAPAQTLSTPIVEGKRGPESSSEVDTDVDGSAAEVVPSNRDAEGDASKADRREHDHSGHSH